MKRTLVRAGVSVEELEEEPLPDEELPPDEVPEELEELPDPEEAPELPEDPLEPDEPVDPVEPVDPEDPVEPVEDESVAEESVEPPSSTGYDNSPLRNGPGLLTVMDPTMSLAMRSINARAKVDWAIASRLF